MFRGFSFWLSTVGINIVLILARSNIPFVRLDGTLSQQQRERVIKQFSEDDTILVCGSACPFLPFLNDFIFSTSVRAVVVDGLVEVAFIILMVVVCSGIIDVIEGWRCWDKSDSSFKCLCHGMHNIELFLLTQHINSSLDLFMMSKLVQLEFYC